MDSLRSALEKARKLSSELAAEVQITECKGFIARAEKRVAALDAQRALEMASPQGRESQVAEVSRTPQVVAGSVQEPDRPDWTARVGAVAREGERVADSEFGAPGLLQTSSSGHLDLREPPGTPSAGGFCPKVQRIHSAVDARSSSRHLRGNHVRQRSRGGQVVPRHGFRSHR